MAVGSDRVGEGGGTVGVDVQVGLEAGSIGRAVGVSGAGKGVGLAGNVVGVGVDVTVAQTTAVGRLSGGAAANCGAVISFSMARTPAASRKISSSNPAQLIGSGPRRAAVSAVGSGDIAI